MTGVSSQVSNQALATTSSPTFNLLTLNNLVNSSEIINLDNTFPTVVLTATSKELQIIICADASSGGEIDLPNATTLAVGRSFNFIISSSGTPTAGAVNIVSSGSGYFAALPALDSTVSSVNFTLINNSTSDGIWNISNSVPSGQWPLSTALGGTGLTTAPSGAFLIGNGSAWTTVGSVPGSGTYGGLIALGFGTTGLQTATGSRQPFLSGTATGNTGNFASWGFGVATTNGIQYFSSTSQMSSISPVNNAVLISNGSGVPSMGTTLPTGVQSNITQLGALVAYTNLATPGSGSANGFIFQGASAGAFGMQAGAGTAAGGGGLTMFGQSHPTKAGWVSACLSSGVGTDYFTVNSQGWLGAGTDVFTVNNAGQVVVGNPSAASAGKITINPVTASVGTLQITAVNSAGAFDGLLQNASLSAARTWTLPDATGTISVLGNAVTGSGSVVLANTPTLVTPVLGAATATSINFGGSTLSNYVSNGTFNSTITAATVGDLSVVYTNQSSQYTRIGNLVYVRWQCNFTPTFTTASGSLRLSGLPFTVLEDAGGAMMYSSGATPMTYPASRPFVVPYAGGGTTYVTLSASGSGQNSADVSMSNITSGSQLYIEFSITYRI